MVKQRVSYFYDTDVGHFYYGPGHPMKPHRIKMAHHLILSTGLYRKLDVYRPHLAAPLEMTRFHSDDYVKFLSKVSPESTRPFLSRWRSSTSASALIAPCVRGVPSCCGVFTSFKRLVSISR